MNREQKIDFLTRLKEGETDLRELSALPPFGYIFVEEGGYRLKDGTLLTEDEYTAFIAPYLNSTQKINGLPVIYGIEVR